MAFCLKPVHDVERYHNMQILSFRSLLEKYQDYDLNPGAESFESICRKFNNPNRHSFFIVLDEILIGGISVIERDNRCWLKQLFILPEYGNRGYAQKAIQMTESLFPNITGWELDTIMQEKKLCHLYEKMGYVPTGRYEHIKEGMDLIFYQKTV